MPDGAGPGIRGRLRRLSPPAPDGGPGRFQAGDRRHGVEPATRSRPGKRSNKERQELESLPGRIEELETALAGLHETMADPAFYRQPSGEIAALKARLESVEQELASTYERWEALEASGG